MSLKHLTVLAVSAGLATALFAQPERTKDAPKKPAAAQPADHGHAAQPGGDMPPIPGMTPEMMKEMEACMKAATPGPEHAYLMEAAGVWEGKNKMWMTADAEPMETTSTATFAPALGGRYLHGEFKGPMPGMGEFEGACIYGYDNAVKEYQMVWVDNMGTGMMTGTGKLSPDKKVMTWTMTWNHPTRGKQTFREVDTRISADEHKMEMYGPGFDGKEYKMMEIVSKRVSKDVPKHGQADHKKDAPKTVTVAQPAKLTPATAEK